MTIHDGKCSLCGPHAQGQKPLRSQLILILILILILTLALTYPHVCRSRGNSKENVYLHGSVNYLHAVNCRKLINVKIHGKQRNMSVTVHELSQKIDLTANVRRRP